MHQFSIVGCRILFGVQLSPFYPVLFLPAESIMVQTFELCRNSILHCGNGEICLNYVGTHVRPNRPVSYRKNSKLMHVEESPKNFLPFLKCEISVTAGKALHTDETQTFYTDN